MKAIKIDVEKQAVYEVEVDKNNVLASWYKLIGCDMVEQVPTSLTSILPDNDKLLVDEEGLINGKTTSTFNFKAMINRHSIAYKFVGNGLIVGVDLNGENAVDCKSTVEEVEKIINFK